VIRMAWVCAEVRVRSGAGRNVVIVFLTRASGAGGDRLVLLQFAPERFSAVAREFFSLSAEFFANCCRRFRAEKNLFTGFATILRRLARCGTHCGRCGTPAYLVAGWLSVYRTSNIHTVECAFSHPPAACFCLCGFGCSRGRWQNCRASTTYTGGMGDP